MKAQRQVGRIRKSALPGLKIILCFGLVSLYLRGRRISEFATQIEIDHVCRGQVATQMDSLFRSENFDFTEKAPCGWHKCFFRLRADYDYDGIGYVIQKNDSWENLPCQYAATKYLEGRYNMSHLLLGPPQEMTLTARFAEQLNANSLAPIGMPGDRVPNYTYSNASSIFFQKVRVAPNPSLLLGCNPVRLQNISERWSGFLELPEDKDVFVENFSKNLANAANLVEKEPWVMRDFQFLVDRDGNTYHIDVDHYRLRSPWHSYDELRNQCRKAFQELFRLINDHKLA